METAAAQLDGRGATQQQRGHFSPMKLQGEMHVHAASRQEARTSPSSLAKVLPARFAALRYRSQQARTSSSSADSPSPRLAYSPAHRLLRGS